MDECGANGESSEADDAAGCEERQKAETTGSARDRRRDDSCERVNSPDGDPEESIAAHDDSSRDLRKDEENVAVGRPA